MTEFEHKMLEALSSLAISMHNLSLTLVRQVATAEEALTELRKVTERSTTEQE